MGSRKYRTKIEVLGDFLEATRQAPTKTRIIGLANLNPLSFQKYLGFCLALGLVEATPRGYRTTSRAGDVLEAIRRVQRESSEADSAIQELQKTFGDFSVKGPDRGEVLRYVSRIAWSQVPHASEGPAKPHPDRRRSLPSTGRVEGLPPPWGIQREEPEPGHRGPSGGYLLPPTTGGPLFFPEKRRPNFASRE